MAVWDYDPVFARLHFWGACLGVRSIRLSEMYSQNNMLEGRLTHENSVGSRSET